MTILALFHYRNSNNRDFGAVSPKSLFLFMAIFILLGGIFVFIRDYFIESDLKQHKYGWAVVTDKHTSMPSGDEIEFFFFYSKRKIESSTGFSGFCYSCIAIGDTVLIKYSTTNPETCELIDRRWNEKTKAKMHYLNKKKK